MRYLILSCVWTSVAMLATSATPKPTEAQTSVTIQVQVAGEPIPDDLVIVESLDTYKELLRAVTDKSGNAPPVDLKPGLYRAIATAPYGLWETVVREFLVKTGQTETQLVVTTSPKPTQDFWIVKKGEGPSAYVHIVKADGSAAVGARVITRSRDLIPDVGNSYQSDSKGWVTIDLTSKPTVVVIVDGEILVTREITDANSTLVVHLPKK